jgi:hypothetical protein
MSPTYSQKCPNCLEVVRKWSYEYAQAIEIECWCGQKVIASIEIGFLDEAS